ncbi:glycosyltransferase family 4 protein [Mycolicibacterium neoaurum]|uniref:Mannosyltransferase n=3 Tax=Mycolicibacterium neoaurum TaxID=1795 RepID=A0AAV2WRC5_MYCNE|nr:mannosyltransferase [Mycolicibacterium neoaurum]
MLRSCLEVRGHDAVVVGPADGQTGADIVVTNGMTGWSHDRKAVRVHVYHGSWPSHVLRGGLDGSSRRSSLRRLLQGAVAEFRAGVGADRVAVSASAKCEVRRWYGLNSTVIENGVDTSVFRPGDRESAKLAVGLDVSRRYALFVGRPEKRKGGVLALQVAAKVGVDLLHAGYPQLPNSIWLGALSPTELATALVASDVVILPSFYEGCSFAVLEALASGTPLVSTSTGWIPDLVQAVPEFNRYVVQPGDLSGLILAAHRALGDEPSVQQQAHSVVCRDNSVEAFGNRWLRFLELALESRSAPERRLLGLSRSGTRWRNRGLTDRGSVP